MESIHPLLQKAREWKAEEDRKAEEAERQHREREFEERLTALAMFSFYFENKTQWEVFTYTPGTELPYIPLGPVAVVGTGPLIVTIFRCCPTCGIPTIPFRGGIGGHWRGEEWTFDADFTIVLLAEADACNAANPCYCAEHQPTEDEE